MNRSLVCVLNAIEEAPTGSDISGLLEHCETHGLPVDMVECLINMPGPATIGRLQQALNAIANGEAPRDAFLAQHAAIGIDPPAEWEAALQMPLEGSSDPSEPPIGSTGGGDAER